MTERKRGGGLYLIVIGIMVVAYQLSRKANPVMLDDQGRPQPTSRS